MSQPNDPRFTNKQNPELASMHDQVSRALGMLTRDEAWNQRVCASCKQPVNPDTDFKDSVSVSEYWITALCQGCQDTLFSSLGE